MMRGRRKRTIAYLFVGSLIVGALGAPAVARNKAATRSEEGSYLHPSFEVFRCERENSNGCVEFFPQAKERFIHVEVTDAAGMAVYAYVNQDADRDGWSDIDGPICGRTEYPLRIVPEVPVRVFILPTWSLCPGAVATTGTVEAIFGNSYAEVFKAAKD